MRAVLPHRIAVLGGGESGIGAALLAAHRGVDVFLSEGKNLGPGYRAELEAAGIPFEEGQHSIDQLLTAEAVVKSPGIPPSHPVVAALKQAGVPIWSDIEWFYQNCPTHAKIAAITGSNGKTTTTSWLGHILRQAGANVQVGGNIGVGAGRLLLEPEADVYVLEVSSYQLEDCPSFRPDVAVLTNITPDHLDRYGSLEAYAETKFAIAQHQGAEDAFVFYGEDPISRRYLEREIEQDLAHVDWAPRVNISAKTGRHLEKLVPALEVALDSWDQRIPTGKLNAFISELVAENPHPVRGGKQPRILFATQASSRPPKFVLFTTGFLDPGYRRFITRRLRETYGFEGTPIEVSMRVREKRKRT